MAKAKTEATKTKTKTETKTKEAVGPVRRGMKHLAEKAKEVSKKQDVGTVYISSGTYSEKLEAAGRTIGQIKDEGRDRLDLHPETMNVVNGEPVGDDYVLLKEDNLVFVRPSGEKGVKA